MTAEHLNELPLKKRLEFIYSWGFYVMKRSLIRHTAILYAVDGFFAELILDKTSNEVVSVSGIQDSEVPSEYYQQAASCFTNAGLPAIPWLAQGKRGDLSSGQLNRGPAGRKPGRR